MDLEAVCVFCASSMPPDTAYRDLARALGRTIAERGMLLVYGGGAVGLMGILADSALEHGGRVIGVIPGGLFSREVPHPGLSELREVRSMHERKQAMYDLADGFIALPGGLGTLEELAEVATWSQLGLHRKPVVLLDTDGFWDFLSLQLDRMRAAALLGPAQRDLVLRAHTPASALELLAGSTIETVAEGLRADER
jgi:uncharacterized protein (TIGR00730 family)